MEKQKQKTEQNCQTQRQCHLLCPSEGGKMSKNQYLTEKWDVKLVGNDLAGLNEIYRELADEIGIENTMVVFNLFRGTQISFPNRLFSKEFIHESILREFNGKNVLQLAQKYNYSERSIWRILKSKKD